MPISYLRRTKFLAYKIQIYGKRINRIKKKKKYKLKLVATVANHNTINTRNRN